MPVYIGGLKVQDFRIGTSAVTALYLGANRVWSKTSMYFNFEGPTTSDLTSLGFVHIGAATYKLCQADGSARIAMPDGISSLGDVTDWVRYAGGVAPSDNGYLEFGFSSLGDKPTPSADHYYTRILARGSNTTNTHGVGVRAELGHIDLISRIAGTEVIRANCGSFDVNDKFRLRIGGSTGNVWTLYRNGEFAGEWNDNAPLAAKGAGFRSLLLSGMGGRELFRPRSFSPMIDYVEYG